VVTKFKITPLDKYGTVEQGFKWSAPRIGSPALPLLDKNNPMNVELSRPFVECLLS